MRNIKLIIEYDGTAYAGWQVQPNGVTIQEVMEKALVTAYRRTLGNNPPPIEVTVKLDSQTGMARVFAEKQVVDEVFDDRFEIDYVDAQRIKPDVELGETVVVDGGVSLGRA